MKQYKILYFILIIALLASSFSYAQAKRKITIDYSGFLDKDEENFPGATIMTRDDMSQVKISHEGAIMWCDQAIHYLDDDFIEAYGNVRIVQGDTVNMTSKYVEYSGKTQLAYASGEVVLTEPSSTLMTDTLYFDRVKQQAYYKSYGTVVKDTSGTITSRIGRYYMQKEKYQFVEDVNLVNEDYVIDTEHLDFYTETGRAHVFGPTTITGETSKIYCERGYYDTENNIGYFLKKSRIDYDNRTVEGDSIFFDRDRSFASATNNIKVTDTINNMIVKGHYAEVFRDKDSVFITKRALAISVQENDSLYIHGDTLMVTGSENNRITRAYYNVKMYKSDLSGKADSIHVNHQTGLTQLINLKRFSTGDAFSQKRTPILWNVENQMTGDKIHLLSNVETEKLDSLKVFNDAFIISKDSLSDGFNQVKGKRLIGLFDENNELDIVDIIKNSEVINYLRDDEQELIGIQKGKSGSINLKIDGNYKVVTFIKQVDGNIYPEDQFPKNATKFRGFVWREDERPRSVEDLFADDPPLDLPVIKGLEDYIPQEDFFDDELLERIESSGKTKDNKKPKENKAARQIPKKVLDKKKLKRVENRVITKKPLSKKKDN